MPVRFQAGGSKIAPDTLSGEYAKMHVHAYTRRRWWEFVLHRYDGWLFLTKPDVCVRLGWVTFGWGRYKETNEECYAKDRLFKCWDHTFKE